MKLLIHSLTSMVRPLKFGNGSVISCYTSMGTCLLIHAKYRQVSICQMRENDDRRWKTKFVIMNATSVTDGTTGCHSDNIRCRGASDFKVGIVTTLGSPQWSSVLPVHPVKVSCRLLDLHRFPIINPSLYDPLWCQARKLMIGDSVNLPATGGSTIQLTLYTP